MSGTARGVDVSSWQHPAGAQVDWWLVAEAGYGFALVKVSQGLGYLNPWARKDLDDAHAAGLLVGAYHFYESAFDSAEQAQFFTGALIGVALDLGTWLDWEPGPLQQFEVGMRANSFVLEADKARPGTGVYCDQSWYEQLLAANAKINKLWLADWDVAKAPDKPLIWQTGQASVPGITGSVDIDELTSTRGINLPSAPVPKRGALAAPAEELTPVADDLPA